ncbi:phosphatidylserine/phosphatidylglycerophosphate/cardiolipin synthase family protein [Frondihabitans sp. PAMC 28766]|uniref:phospholipase D-like domain-containing protein n=1 Tax=Frondihabitans sp. PAMC 28766 TaxID=1795630 RepID=UPI00138F3BD6|nr:phospholipase D-like domain-containing protein [Frondihabitans sp. PAMC 28766]
MSQRQRRTAYITATTVVVIAAAATLWASGQMHHQAGTPDPVSTRTAVPTAAPTPVPVSGGESSQYELLQEPGAGVGQIYALITGATSSIDMTMYELADPIAQADLVAAAKRGVTVDVLLDAASAGREENAAAYNQLTAGGVQVKWEPSGTIVHQKTITIDGAVSVVGTANLTSRYYQTTRDAWIIDRNPAQVSAIAATFTADYAAAPGSLGQTAAAPGLLWSPGAEPGMVAAITGATQSVDFTSEELADRRVVAALAADARRGVTCRVVLTADREWDSAFHTLEAAGCGVHVFSGSRSSLYMHEKEVLTDGSRLLIGSQNASVASLVYNRELSLQLTTSQAPGVIRSVASTFDTDYEMASPWRE